MVNSWYLGSSVKRLPSPNGWLDRTLELDCRIGCLSHEGVDDLVHTLPLAELAINNSVNDSTRLSPAHIIYG